MFKRLNQSEIVATENVQRSKIYLQQQTVVIMEVKHVVIADVLLVYVD